MSVIAPDVCCRTSEANVRSPSAEVVVLTLLRVGHLDDLYESGVYKWTSKSIATVGLHCKFAPDQSRDVLRSCATKGTKSSCPYATTIQVRMFGNMGEM